PRYGGAPCYPEEERRGISVLDPSLRSGEIPRFAQDDLLAAHGRVWHSCSGRRSELVFQRPGGELGASVKAELVHDLEHVRLSRALGDRQLLSNLAIGQASGKQSRDFLFTSGEPLRVETDERRRRRAGRAALRAFAGLLFRRRLGRLLDGQRGGNCVFESHDASFGPGAREGLVAHLLTQQCYVPPLARISGGAP